MGRKWTAEEKKAASERAKAAYNQVHEQKAEIPQQSSTQLLTFTPEQLQQLVAALTNGTSDKAAAPSFSLNGQQTNSQGQVVGSIIKFPIDDGYYPDPTDELTKFMNVSKRTRRFGFSDNYYLTWDWDSKPYDTKYGTSMREPTFHVTLYANQYDETGEETGNFIVIQTFHFNEDESTALTIAAEMGYDATHDNMRQVMNDARFERVKRWLLGVFFPENNFGLNESSFEEAIGGSVVKVVTKSNVQGFGNKTPKIDIDELQ